MGTNSGYGCWGACIMSCVTTTPNPSCQSVSVLYEILSAVKSRLDASGCLPNTVVRKRPTTLDLDTFPLVVIAPLEGEKIRFEAFGYIAYDYSIIVSLVQIGNRQYETNIEKDLIQREAIRQALTGVTLPNTNDTKVWDTNIAMNDPLYIPYKGSTGVYQVNTFVANYSTLEPRVNLN